MQTLIIPAMVSAEQQRKRRLSARPKINFPPELPITGALDELTKLIEKHQVVILAGETGSGKTTQIPKLCLAMGRGIDGQIAHTQPRRLAARSVSARIAEELSVTVGQEVGYQVRFDDRSSEDGYIKLMTDGILLTEFQRDPLLKGYDTIIVDEAHERSLNIDVILGLLKHLLPKRPDLKVIITSATIDPERFSKFFNDAPMLEVSGRTYPVSVEYQPLESDDGARLSIEEGIHRALKSLGKKGRGDTLVFLPSEQDIRHCHQYLRKHLSEDYELLPLYGRLSAAQQNRIFKTLPKQRVILSTNIAETSLTVPGIQYVIDSGLARISRYSVRSKVQRLPIEPVSQASAEQRKGRCGRISEGHCVRLFSEADYIQRSEYTEPEITRTNLASVILSMKVLSIDNIDEFPFIDSPSNSALNDGFKLLFELGALDNKQRLTNLGKRMANLPIDPRLAAMMLSAESFESVEEILIICAALSIQDPRERPHEFQQKADELHRRFLHPDSDFISTLNLWRYISDLKEELSWNQLRQRCQGEFIHFARIREWRELYAQFKALLKRMKVKLNQQPADYEQIHRAILAGTMSQVANQNVDCRWFATRQTELKLFPGSALAKKIKKPEIAYNINDRQAQLNRQWVLMAEVIETTQTYAVSCAYIHPAWLEEQAAHLLKHRYSDPYWSKRAARAMVNRSSTLYGLPVVLEQPEICAKRYPDKARELFITHALIRGEYRTQSKLLKHNWESQKAVEALEERVRRRDVSVSEDQIYSFYDEQLPGNIHNGKAFEYWAKRLNAKAREAFLLTEEKLIALSDAELNLEDFPTQQIINEMPVDLDYKYEPNAVDDGLQVKVSIAQLQELSDEDFEWLVPGLLKEKLMALLRALPKPIRRQCVPIPDFVETLQQQLKQEEGSLKEQLAAAIKHRIGQPFDSQVLDELDISDTYKPTYHVIDLNGKTLATGNRLSPLKKKLSSKLDSVIQSKSPEVSYKDFPEAGFEPVEHIIRQGQTLTVYKGLKLKGEDLTIQSFAREQQAERVTRQALLALLNREPFDKQIRKTVDELKPYELAYATLDANKSSVNSIFEDLSLTILSDCIGSDACQINSLDAYRQLQQRTRQAMLPEVVELFPVIKSSFDLYKQCRKQIQRMGAPAQIKVRERLQKRLQTLMSKGFIAEAGLEHIRQYPRYLKACLFRIEQAQLKPEIEEQRERLWALWWQRFTELSEASSMEAIRELRWLIEEFHLSIFAQQLGTRQKVSEKRLEKQFEEIAEAEKKAAL